MDNYYAAACQTDFAAPADRSEIAARTKRMCEMVEQTSTGVRMSTIALMIMPLIAQ